MPQKNEPAAMPGGGANVPSAEFTREFGQDRASRDSFGCRISLNGH
jgi:hypothetical protein